MKKTVLATVIFLIAGAAHAAPAPVDDLTGAGVDQRVERLERIIRAKQQSDLALQAQVDSLQREVLDLRGTIEQQTYQLNQMLQRQRQLYDEVAQLGNQASSVASSNIVTTPQDTNTNAGSSFGERDSYENAVNLVLKKRQYDDAIIAFGSFIKDYPNSNYAANANYWLGQLLYNKNELSDAQKAFLTVISRFKESNKRADSMIKLGLIAEKMNDRTLATKYYKQVIKEYADSSAARIAVQQLSSLNS